MTITLHLKEKFDLPNGITVLACTGAGSMNNVVGKQLRLTSKGEHKQKLSITGERQMLNKHTDVDLRAFETNDVVSLSSEEVRAGEWLLVEE